MPAGAIIGSSVIGAGASIYGANKAADAQREAAANAMGLQREMFDRTMGEAHGALDPFITTGKSALTSLAQFYGLTLPDGSPGGEAVSENALEAFRRSPDYAFARDEGIKALTATRAGAGLLHSGNYLRDLSTFSSGLASQNLGNYLGRLLSLSESGRGAATSLAGAITGVGTNAGNSLANLALAGGQATASGIVGSTNAITGGISSGVNNLMLYNLMNKGSGSVYSGSAPISLGNYGGTGLPGYGGLY